MPKVYSQGSFDILHKGHINLLKKCKKLAGNNGSVVVSLLSDASYEKYRGYKPTVPFESRKAVLESLKFVDKVIEGDNTNTRMELISEMPDFIVVGSDWATKDIYLQYDLSPEWFEENNITLLFFPYTKDVSSTQLKKGVK